MSNNSSHQDQTIDKPKILKGLFLWSRLGAGLSFAGFLLSAYNALGLIFTAQLSGFFLLFIPLGFAWLSYVLLAISCLVDKSNIDGSIDYTQSTDWLWLVLSKIKLFFQSTVLFIIVWMVMMLLFAILGLLKAAGKL